jgi:transglutaminase-like putative cysteine protease
MLYKVRHLTSYDYKQAGNLSYNETWLTPRSLPYQIVRETRIEVQPKPAVKSNRQDIFANHVAYFNIQQAHTHFSVESISIIERKVPAYTEASEAGISWENWLAEYQLFNPDYIEMKQFSLASPLVPVFEELKTYALVSFQPGRDLLHAVADLSTRIYHDFEYNPGFTTIATPLRKVMEAKKGVCQDFAHVAIACLRALGLPARYISGYIETIPPEGSEALVGSAASHAWFSAFIPTLGWVDFDPTNNQIAKDQHITVAWGRDYTDVPPIKGVIFNSGAHELSVAVDVIRINDGEY